MGKPVIANINYGNSVHGDRKLQETIFRVMLMIEILAGMNLV